MQNQTLIAIKAPHGTTLEVPDPDEVGCKTILVCHPQGHRGMLMGSTSLCRLMIILKEGTGLC
jgi:hypothetical protein